ncbi:hypothetical protein [Cellulomonas massiliensis]|uniref:hypothetical protein n=1 Tax=Cellulomonas massiliensis TaxID=1465811 RepID=UPI0003126C33|nr:hypothetical protein [Cellulomonas massiliensis]
MTSTTATPTAPTARLPRRTLVVPGVWSFKGSDGRTYVVQRVWGLHVVHSEKALARGPQPSTYISEHATMRDALTSV